MQVACWCASMCGCAMAMAMKPTARNVSTEARSHGRTSWPSAAVCTYMFRLLLKRACPHACAAFPSLQTLLQ